MPLLRLDRMLSSQGIGSRKEIKQQLSHGNITVNGKVVKSAAVKVDTDKDIVRQGGKTITYSEYIYIMMNKPSGVISASNDPKAETVINLLPEELLRPGLFPAGRLDKDTEGFMLITDDGGFAHNILSPKRHVDKSYFAVIDGTLTDDDMSRFETGLDIGEGITSMPAQISFAESLSDGKAAYNVVIHEGKFHQIKRMFFALGREVLYLKRTAIGNLPLDDTLEPGDSRALSDEEIDKIARKATL